MSMKIRKLCFLCFAGCFLLLTACTPKNIENQRIPTSQDSLVILDKADKTGTENPHCTFRTTPIPVTYRFTENYPSIQLFTEETAAEMTSSLHTLFQKDEIGTEKVLPVLSYAEYDFHTKSLMGFPINQPVGTSFTVTDVIYQENQVTVYGEWDCPPVGTLQVAAFTSYYIFVEVDAVIPLSSDITLDISKIT